MRFQHPANEYVETCTTPFLWALIFGPLYFVLKGIWRHVVLYFVVNTIVFTAWWTLAALAMTGGAALIGAFGVHDPNQIANAAAILGMIVAVSLVLPFLIYPFLAGGIVRRHFLRQGWSEVA